MINFSTEENEGTWFYFDKENKESGGVCLRELSTDEYTKIAQITTKTTKKVKRGVAYDDVQTDERLAAKMRWDYCIVDWKDIQIDGKPADCSSDNKQKLIKVGDFIKFIADCIEELAETNSSLNEARVKNFTTS